MSSLQKGNEVSEYLNLMEVARQLGVSEKTARRYVKRGELRSYYVGGRFKVAQEDLDAYVRESVVPPGKAPAPKPGRPKGVVERARERMAAVGEEMHSFEVDAYLRARGCYVTLMPWDEFAALEDLELEDFRRYRRQLQLERETLQDAQDGSRTAALALLRCSSRVTNWLHPQEAEAEQAAKEFAPA